MLERGEAFIGARGTGAPREERRRTRNFLETVNIIYRGEEIIGGCSALQGEEAKAS